MLQAHFLTHLKQTHICIYWRRAFLACIKIVGAIEAQVAFRVASLPSREGPEGPLAVLIPGGKLVLTIPCTLVVVAHNFCVSSREVCLLERAFSFSNEPLKLSLVGQFRLKILRHVTGPIACDVANSDN